MDICIGKIMEEIIICYIELPPAFELSPAFELPPALAGGYQIIHSNYWL
jgi:hypothetical protein